MSAVQSIFTIYTTSFVESLPRPALWQCAHAVLNASQNTGMTTGQIVDAIVKQWPQRGNMNTSATLSHNLSLSPDFTQNLGTGDGRWYLTGSTEGVPHYSKRNGSTKPSKPIRFNPMASSRSSSRTVTPSFSRASTDSTAVFEAATPVESDADRDCSPFGTATPDAEDVEELFALPSVAGDPVHITGPWYFPYFADGIHGAVYGPEAAATVEAPSCSFPPANFPREEVAWMQPHEAVVDPIVGDAIVTYLPSASEIEFPDYSSGSSAQEQLAAAETLEKASAARAACAADYDFFKLRGGSSLGGIWDVPTATPLCLKVPGAMLPTALAHSKAYPGDLLPEVECGQNDMESFMSF